MLVLLPPSETKAHGGDGPPLDLDALSFPALNPTRDRIASALVALAADAERSRDVLGLSPRQSTEVERNAALRGSPTTGALHRYTGVLYDALDVEGLTGSERARAHARLAVASALFGVVRARDPIPAYRLSAATTLPDLGSLRGLWRPALEPVLTGLDELVVDLRSGPYAALARMPDAVTVRVVTDNGTGKRTTVSHHNKAYKGRLAGALARATREPATIDDLLTAASSAGFKMEQTGEQELELLVQ
ncbi:peroxide stress protein YaaA [Haloechinothrix sp. LS1_15]|uniref:peroxide stress protein YaaA n=1 Tax=Haloechinothrix sp. LS1_15 TaxID=2652248 RepID=UPI002946D86F|nr:peroxide stress protein YaaA [Haloechinothrix sp. LS1_15]MDV6012771.1 peroxide stress protein YaaA [Haloechinothrix sp. LS1_15]